MGGDSLLAFFEIPRGQQRAADRDAIGGMQHVAFSVTPTRFEEIHRRLRELHLRVDGPVNTLPGMVSLYFYDPNGIRLECCCQPADGERQHVIAAATQTQGRARGELRTLGAEAPWIDEMVASLPEGR